MQTTRRTLVRGAAWTAPAVVAATAAPAFATTGSGLSCPSLAPATTPPANGTDATNISGWTTQLGNLAAARTVYTTTWTYRPPTNATGATRWPGWVFESWRDNALAVTDSGATTTYNTLTATMQVVAGRTYDFAMPIRGGWGNNDEAAGSSAQFIDITIAGSNVFKANTRGTGHGATPSGYPWLDTTASAQDNTGQSAFLVPVTKTFSYTAAFTGAVPFVIRLGLMPRNRALNPQSGWNIGTDDLMVGIPTVTCR